MHLVRLSASRDSEALAKTGLKFDVVLGELAVVASLSALPVERNQAWLYLLGLCCWEDSGRDVQEVPTLYGWAYEGLYGCLSLGAASCCLVRLFLSGGYSLILRLVLHFPMSRWATLFVVLFCTRMFGLLVGYLQLTRVGLASQLKSFGYGKFMMTF